VKEIEWEEVLEGQFRAMVEMVCDKISICEATEIEDMVREEFLKGQAAEMEDMVWQEGEQGQSR
jgi:hypothetical protein